MSQRPEDPGESYIDRYQREEVERRTREYRRLDRDRAAARGGAVDAVDPTLRNVLLVVGVLGAGFAVLSLIFAGVLFWLMR